MLGSTATPTRYACFLNDSETVSGPDRDFLAGEAQNACLSDLLQNELAVWALARTSCCLRNQTRYCKCPTNRAAVVFRLITGRSFH